MYPIVSVHVDDTYFGNVIRRVERGWPKYIEEKFD
jgi:hypothetical protein